MARKPILTLRFIIMFFFFSHFAVSFLAITFVMNQLSIQVSYLLKELFTSFAVAYSMLF